MRVKEIMRPVKVISPDASIKEAATMMNKSSIGSLVVVDENRKVSGILTERDILQKVTAVNKLPSKVLVSEIMTPKVISITSHALIDDAVYLMMKHKIKKLPVVEDKRLVGIITATDVVANSSEIGQFYLFG